MKFISNIETIMNPLHDIEVLLRERIETGIYEAGGRIPSEREICEELKVHRRAVRSAIKLLERDGLVRREPHCRATVRTPDAQNAHSEYHDLNPRLPYSRFVALMMWRGSPQEEIETGQQRIFWGMNHALGQAGYHTVFLDLFAAPGAEDENIDHEATYLQYALDQGFGGIVLYCYSYRTNQALIRKVARRVPLVLIDRELPGVEADFVGIANHQAMYNATKYLIDLGHRRIAHVTRSEPINSVQDRLQGYLSALRESFHFDYYEMVLAVPSLGGNVWPAMDSILGLPPDQRPTALVCVNDFEAVYAAEYLARFDLRVPCDMSIIGCDNIITKLPGGIGLTTTAQPFEEIGAEAAKHLLRRFQSNSIDIERFECPTTLLIRESCRAI